MQFRIPLSLAAVTLLAATAPLGAQQRAGQWQVRISSGRLVATGQQRDAIKDAPVIAAQVSRTVSTNLAVIATLGWARSRDLAAASSPRLDIWSADLGLEGRVAHWSLGGTATFTPFAGAGLGARSHDSRVTGVESTSAIGGYVAAGGELGVGRFGLRLEVRDYITDHGAASGRRNDIVMMGAIRFNRNRVP